ncbi:hypothetical protein B296_00004995, partial [Ensete ventricosum]
TKDRDGKSPFSLAFCTKVVLPPKVVFPTLRVSSYREGVSEGLWANFDLLEEKRAEARLQALAYKKTMVKLYNHRGKLWLNWEGPYWVVDAVKDGTFQLTT